MKLFINSGVCERLWDGKIESEKNNGISKCCLSIPNYLKNGHKQKNINFVFYIEGINEKSFEKDLLLENVSLVKTSENYYSINNSEEILEDYIYALIRGTNIVPDDVFIPVDMKDNVTVLQKIHFIDQEVDYGVFLSNVYLIKIKLDYNESIPIYLTYKNPKLLERHYVFYKTWYGECTVSEKLKTFIYINESNKDKYISLSELVKNS